VSLLPPDIGLSQASTEALRRLLDAIEAGRIEPPFSAASLAASGLATLAAHAGMLFGLDRAAVCTALRLVLAERNASIPSHVDLVWTGPDAPSSEARYTGLVVRQLFERAREHVIIGGYSFDHGADLFAPLHRVMVEHGVTTEIFVDIGQMDTSLRRWARSERRDIRERLKLLRSAREQSTTEYADAVVAWFIDAQWPFGEPCPTVHYDVRTAERHARVSLHAKCVIVDQRYTLITSANFTDRGHSRNIEAGVVIDDVAFARRLAVQWRTVRGPNGA
jgi:phosphatidylserine/phosphatidylglycerophosphate/cardiolipin synthase-like enzyme